MADARRWKPKPVFKILKSHGMRERAKQLQSEIDAMQLPFSTQVQRVQIDRTHSFGHCWGECSDGVDDRKLYFVRTGGAA